jgi:L-lactate utilization protein LutB
MGTTDMDTIDAAAQRLQSALDALETAIERRLEDEIEQSELTGQIHALGVDRSRLASELDTAAARSRRLETTHREVVQRLDAAIETIRTLLDAHEQ